MDLDGNGNWKHLWKIIGGLCATAIAIVVSCHEQNNAKYDVDMIEFLGIQIHLESNSPLAQIPKNCWNKQRVCLDNLC